MSSDPADNPFKQIGPRSGSTFCPDMIGVQTVWHLEELKPMYFNFTLNRYMTLSFADNPFKQFGPRSGQTFCLDLKGVQTVWHFRGYDKLKLKQMYFNFALNLYMALSSADNPFKQFGTRSSLTFCPVWKCLAWSRSKLFDTLVI